MDLDADADTGNQIANAIAIVIAMRLELALPRCLSVCVCVLSTLLSHSARVDVHEILTVKDFISLRSISFHFVSFSYHFISFVRCRTAASSSHPTLAPPPPGEPFPALPHVDFDLNAAGIWLYFSQPLFRRIFRPLSHSVPLFFNFYSLWCLLVCVWRLLLGHKSCNVSCMQFLGLVFGLSSLKPSLPSFFYSFLRLLL